jgi:mycoredoxin
MFWEKEESNRKEAISLIPGQVVVYGTSWCAKTQMVRRFFERMQIPYRYLDIEDNPSAVKELRWLTGGHASHPTVVIDGQTYIEPTVSELEMVIAKYK